MTRPNSKASIDISVVINVHREIKYFRRTMMSLEQAVEYAQSFGLRIELIIVLDRPDAASVEWFNGYDASFSDSKTIIEVDNGSLGLSRNDGIRAASGTFIATFDADDLVSFNYFAALYDTAIQSSERSLIFAEYLFAFGANHYLAQYRSRPELSLLAFIADHPLMSRVMTRRTTFDELCYTDLHISKGYAYEDWHFNAEAIGRGFEFHIAPSTTIFYRQRRGSLLKIADNLSVKTIPAAKLFNPETYVSVCEDDYARWRRGQGFKGDAVATRDAFLSSQLNLQAALMANHIDAAIDISVIEQIPCFTNAEGDVETGAAYYEIARELRGRRFTDVVLFPFMTTGGGEKYILNILNTLKELDKSRQFLIVAGQGGVRHKWIERLPEGSVFLDVFNRFPKLSSAQRELIVLKLVQTTATDAMLHLKCSQFAQDFFTRFAAVLSANRNVFYRFSDQIRPFEDRFFTNGYSADFISENMEALDLIVSDNERIMSDDLRRMDSISGKEACLSTLCELAEMPPERRSAKHTKRLLWASRLDPEKRPELLKKIAVALERARPDLSIDVWGESYSGFDVAQLERLPNVRVRGSYSGFASLEPQQYDVFLYTTAFDGLPNVVIEAMASELPVIAPDIGGIPEALIDRETGVLLSGTQQDDELVSAYLGAIEWLYKGDDRIRTIGRRAFEHVQARHGPRVFKEKVAEIFGLSMAPPTVNPFEMAYSDAK